MSVDWLSGHWGDASHHDIVDIAWRPIEGFPHYMVSELGDVRSTWGAEPRLLSPVWDERYLRVTLCRSDGPPKQFRLHQVVATAFHGPRPDGLVVRHLDGNALNNSASNLTYGTPAENIQDQLRHGTHWAAGLTHCQRGHAFDEANSYPRSDGYRQCRACMTEAKRRREKALNGVKTVCENCGATVGVASISHHRATAKCKRGFQS